MTYRDIEFSLMEALTESHGRRLRGPLIMGIITLQGHYPYTKDQDRY
jgi:hypothetical protein